MPEKAFSVCIKDSVFIDPARKPATYCRDYRVGCWVLWDGMMRFCSFMDEPNIPVRDMPFEKAWHQLLDYEEALDWPAECKACEAAKVCARCAEMVCTKQAAARLQTAADCARTREIWENIKL